MKSRTNGHLKNKRSLIQWKSLFKLAPPAKSLKEYGLTLPKSFKAGMFVARDGTPKLVVFDAYSIWDLLCVIDEKMEKAIPESEYVHNNPIGWLIDAIESRLPVNPKIAAKLKKAVRKAGKAAPIPFAEILGQLGMTER